MMLVLGGGGHVGRELVAAAASDGLALTALGHAEVDVADPKSIAIALARIRASVVINAAAFTRVDDAETRPAEAHRVNTLGASVVAFAAKRAGAPVIHISTDYVFDGGKGAPYFEDDAPGPLSVYGRTKAKGEEGVRNANPQHLILRTSWLFGSHGTNFLTTVLRLAAERESLSFTADQRSTPTATVDLAQAIFRAVAAIGKGTAPWGTYHVAGAAVASRYDMATAIVAAQARFTGRTPPVYAVAAGEHAAAAARPVFSGLNSDRFAAAFGYRPRDWSLAVEDVVADAFATSGQIR
jgi:dTDP-4-dehydrorhamnose reductase